MIQKCNWKDCPKPRAEPFEYCLPHFADATVEFYIAGIKLPAWSNDSTGFGEWTMQTGKQTRAKKKGSAKHGN